MLLWDQSIDFAFDAGTEKKSVSFPPYLILVAVLVDGLFTDYMLCSSVGSLFTILNKMRHHDETMDSSTNVNRNDKCTARW